MLVYLITHAATTQQRTLDADQWGLSDEGRAQAAKLAAAPFWERVGQVVVSSEPKTRLTVADVVARRGLPVWVDSRLDELRRGGWVENYGAHVAQAFANPDEAHGEWEPARYALARVLAAMQAIQQRFKGQNVAVVGHGLTLSLLRAHYLGQAHVDYEAWSRLAFGAVAAVELPSGRWVQDFPLEPSSARA